MVIINKIIKGILILPGIFITLYLNGVYSQTYRIQAKSEETGAWGYLDMEAKFVIEPVYVSCNNFSEDGYASIYFYDIGDYEYINTEGDFLDFELEDFKCSRIYNNFKDGLLPVKYNKKWGFVNTEGKVQIEAKYDFVTAFDNGYASARIGETFIIIDKEGNEVTILIPEIDGLRKFSEGLAPFFNKEGLFGYINKKGKIVIPAQYKGSGYFKAGLAWARENARVKKIGFINKKGEWVIKPNFKTAYEFDDIAGIARVEYEGEWWYIKKTGEMYYNKEFKKIGDYSEGLAQVEVRNGVGFYNSDFKWEIKPQFQAVRDFHCGYAAANINDKWGIINKKGEWVIQPVYEDMKDVVIVE